MKKFFSLFVTAAVALFGLTCCGGGGDDSERGFMSVKDFAAGAKKFILGYQLQMEIQSYGSSGESRVTELRADFVPGVMLAGKAEIPVSMSYSLDAADARTAKLYFSVKDSAEDLADKDFLTGLGFPVLATDSASGTAIYLPNTVTSISGITCTLEFDFDAGMMRCTGEYEGVEFDENGNIGSTQRYTLNNGKVPFIVTTR